MPDLLTFDGYSGRAEGVRFDLVSPGLAKIGELSPSEESIASVENSMNRAVKRTMTGLHLSPADVAAIDPFRDRIRPMWLIANPESGQIDEYPVGVFAYANVSRRRLRFHADTGTEADANLGDLLMAFDQPLDQSVTYPPGMLVTTILEQLAQQAGIYVTGFEPSSTALRVAVSFVAGRDTRLKVLNEIAALAGFYSPWFDNAGVLRAESVPEVGAEPARFDYDDPPRIYEGTIVLTDDALSAPNRYLVIDNGSVDAPITGVYDVPAHAPHSIANRGYPVTKIIELQGLDSSRSARDAARAAALQDRSAFSWCEAQTVPDPRHDTYDVVQFENELWREQSWRLALAPGGPQLHSWRRTYRERF